ncbi:MAG TPA: hypothetical protein VI072_20000, partial [Polyangiaceae bacterium]
MPNSPLSVVKNDTACVLTLTGLQAAVGYVGTPSIALGTAYAGTGSSFATSAGDGGTNPIAFYGNAKLSANTFVEGFTMTVLFSDTLLDTNAPETTATYATVTSSGGETQVVSPDYTLNFTSHILQADVNQEVQSSTGTIGFENGPSENPGEFYVINTDQTALGSTFAEIDAAYTAGSSVAVGATIPAV